MISDRLSCSVTQDRSVYWTPHACVILGRLRYHAIGFNIKHHRFLLLK
jgi:hypothetical protein